VDWLVKTNVSENLAASIFRAEGFSALNMESTRRQNPKDRNNCTNVNSETIMAAGILDNGQCLIVAKRSVGTGHGSRLRGQCIHEISVA
jgi:hypothetical protein